MTGRVMCSDCGRPVAFVTMKGGVRVAIDTKSVQGSVRMGVMVEDEKGRFMRPQDGGIYRMHEESCPPKVEARKKARKKMLEEQAKRRDAWNQRMNRGGPDGE